MQPLIGVIMGSRSDWETMQHATQTLDKLQAPYEVRIVSAHRTPELLFEYAGNAEARGLQVIIAGAGGAAHLPGMVAARTQVPVLGVPMQSHALNGLDSLLSIVQMPAGIPVGTLAIGRAGAINAALLAVAILANQSPVLREALRRFRAEQTQAVLDHADPRGRAMMAYPERIGVLGGGQLGRMLALAGYPLGIHVRCLDSAPAAPAGVLCELVVGAYEDEATLTQFAAGMTAITYEFENVPVATARYLAQFCPIYPPPAALETAQDRLVEKSFLRDLGIPTPAFLPVTSRTDFDAAVAKIGLPAVLKTRRLGYDGKGQAVIRTAADREAAWTTLHGAPLILEGWVNFDREVSLLAVRSTTGELAFYPLIENYHKDGILRRSYAPAPNLTPDLQTLAETYARRSLAALNYVGVLAIEFFQVGQQLVANELAPRVHNSGHWTIEGATTSQFANHLRAILGLPLGDTAAIGHSVMLNLIGSLPDPVDVLAVPGAHLHLYDKAPRPGRKLGHITLRADDPNVLAARLAQLQQVTEPVVQTV